MNIKKKGGTKSEVRVQNPEPLNAEPRTLNLEVRRQKSVQVSGFRCQVSGVRSQKLEDG